MSQLQPIADAIAKVTDLAKPIVEKACEFAEALLGESLRVSGSALADHIYAWQTRNRISILEKTQRICEKRNVDPKRVATGWLLPALDAMGNVEADELQDLWARLLSRAVEDDEAQTPLHIETLRRMSSVDAQALNAVAGMIRSRYARVPRGLSASAALTHDWAGMSWMADRAPSDELASTWGGVLCRLEAMNILTRDYASGTRALARVVEKRLDNEKRISENLDNLQKAIRSGRWTRHALPSSDSERRDIERMTRAINLRLSPYGFDFIQALGLTEVRAGVGQPDDPKPSVMA